MLKSGLCSITFRQLTVAQLTALVKKAGLDAIEWGGDVHVPPGDVGAAREALRLTQKAGLEVSSYGSYYRVIDADGNIQPFGPVLESALALGTDTIRIWAGTCSSETISNTCRKKIVEELYSALELAAAHGVRLALEFHSHTLADSHEAVRALLDEVNHPFLYTYWQPVYWQSDMDYQLDGLSRLSDHVLNLHLFHWTVRSGEGSLASRTDRHPLAEGFTEWQRYLTVPLNPVFKHYALMEFVRDDDPEQFLRDAAVLKKMLGA